jgi:hypothetical protein
MASTTAAEKYSSPTVASFPADNDSDSSADGCEGVCVFAMWTRKTQFLVNMLNHFIFL